MPTQPADLPPPLFADGLAERPPPLRLAITAATRLPEPLAVQALLEPARQSAPAAALCRQLALKLAGAVRQRKVSAGREGLVQGLLQEYALSSHEGVALMCLAEALLRIPDAGTRDALIRDRIAAGDWQRHAGHSPSLFVNAATWGLMLTGRLVAAHTGGGMAAVLARVVARGGEPMVRKGVDLAVRLLGEQFVAGQTIAEALHNARAREATGFRHSYDMLGEAALTEADAQRYLADYRQAITAIGRAAKGLGVQAGPGISIKLSALHPCYCRAQYGRVMAELYPRLRSLALQAREQDIGLNIDAEESDRLELSLDLLERLCVEPALAGWDGIGFVIQAYQKRCPRVVDFIVDLARRSGHRLMVRLVKGAYWDSEIKRAQVDGQAGYPVYTRKPHTDVAYLACARRLLAAPDAVYPQFATHNAHTVAAIHQMADPARWSPGQYEFQCLHGMGEPLYEQVTGSVASGGLGRPCRIYAPVGTHETLLAYLVRRLLENGANSSFVNRIADPAVALESLVEDPVETVHRMAAQDGRVGLAHPAIPLPAALYDSARANSAGLDLNDDDTLRRLSQALALAPPVASVPDASAQQIQLALADASQAAAAWAGTAATVRADALEAAADLLQDDLPLLIGLLAREAGKSAPNAVGEVREAVDFLRYQAALVRSGFRPESHRPLGVVVCISPWNFPLSIFIGQVGAALATGNTVLAKPAEQTPCVAAHAVHLLWQAGIPRQVLHLVPGPGETTGAALVADARVQGVLFTGSTEVGRLLQKSLATRLGHDGKPVVLIAETGGQNAMLVDSSALAEQVVTDVMASAFDSAGQRCSALRLLCLQEDCADRILAMLKGAMAQMRLGDPARLAVDIGPVIDAEARDRCERHVEAMQAQGRKVFRAAFDAAAPDLVAGNFVLPTLIEIEQVSDLQGEVFGPVLHVLRYRRPELDALLAEINATGWGLTLGLHTRIDETMDRVIGGAKAGNVYVNRNMVGAVVGVQPFGGVGLSGTGPKAGGPLYLYRLLSHRPAGVLVAVAEGLGTPLVPAAPPGEGFEALQAWAFASGRTDLQAHCVRFAGLSACDVAYLLTGPTGERNVYGWTARDAVLCLAETEEDRLMQLAAVLAVGSRAVWPAAAGELYARLPERVQRRIVLVDDWTRVEPGSDACFDVVLMHGDGQALIRTAVALANRDGPIVGLVGMSPGDACIPLERLVMERSCSINTAAAGGNASLMTLGSSV